MGLPALMIGSAVASGVSSIFGAISAGRAKREAEKKEREARAEMERLRQAYKDLDTSNPFANLQNQFLNMENTMEDLTVNQQQARFQAQQFQQSQANILGNLRGAAGGSGIAALAQSLAQQGQLASQQASASIGQQEAANQRAAAQQAANLQLQERQGQSNLDLQVAQGERQSQQMEMGKTATLLGMSQQETAAYMQQAQAANQAKWNAISSGIGSLTNMVGSYYQGAGAR
tara:strand:+ start:21038 stop:21730 length:693 start_codon:yes stop_codon:yes gene_type:complete